MIASEWLLFRMTHASHCLYGCDPSLSNTWTDPLPLPVVTLDLTSLPTEKWSLPMGGALRWLMYILEPGHTKDGSRKCCCHLIRSGHQAKNYHLCRQQEYIYFTIMQKEGTTNFSFGMTTKFPDLILSSPANLFCINGWTMWWPNSANANLRFNPATSLPLSHHNMFR